MSKAAAVAITREVVSAALQKGSITLLGPDRPTNAEGYAKADALYLATLIEETIAKLTGPGEQ